MNPAFPPYCTDEDVFIEASEDYTQLCPVGQCLARGGDGVIPDGWTVAGASLAWLPVGAVLTFHRAGPGGAGLLMTDLGSPSDAAIVVGPSVAVAGAVVIRRPGLPAGVGMPFGGNLPPIFGYQSFTIAPQIAAACWDLDRRFGVDDAIPGRRHLDLVAPAELQPLAVAAVLAARYLSATNQAGGTVGTGGQINDDFTSKAAAYAARLETLVARASIRFVATNGNPGENLTRFNCRIVR